jgi:hypothetical protein
MTATRSRIVTGMTAFAVAVAVVGAVAVVVTWVTPSNQCDNMAGTCIRERQQAAIALIRLACLVAALLPLGIAFVAWWRPRFALGHRATFLAASLALLVLCGAFAVWALAADPVTHLNDRWGGWLADG